MRKLFFTLFIIASVQSAVMAQATTDKKALAKAETRTELISKLSFSEANADRIIEIENEFFASLAAANLLSETTTAEKKEKHGKIHAAHVLRRSKLMELPLNGRQMEDVIELSESIRRKHKV